MIPQCVSSLVPCDTKIYHCVWFFFLLLHIIETRSADADDASCVKDLKTQRVRVYVIIDFSPFFLIRNIASYTFNVTCQKLRLVKIRLPSSPRSISGYPRCRGISTVLKEKKMRKRKANINDDVIICKCKRRS